MGELAFSPQMNVRRRLSCVKEFSHEHFQRRSPADSRWSLGSSAEPHHVLCWRVLNRALW